MGPAGGWVGRCSNDADSTEPRFPVTLIAVRCAPGMGCAWKPRLWTASTTLRTWSAVAAESMTISIGLLSLVSE